MLGVLCAVLLLAQSHAAATPVSGSSVLPSVVPPPEVGVDDVPSVTVADEVHVAIDASLPEGNPFRSHKKGNPYRHHHDLEHSGNPFRQHRIFEEHFGEHDDDEEEEDEDAELFENNPFRRRFIGKDPTIVAKNPFRHGGGQDVLPKNPFRKGDSGKYGGAW